ncbi:MAG: NIPSNAP family protein [Bacteroidota bacterium]
MKRRHFVQTGLAASALPITSLNAQQQESSAKESELYELRTYELRFRGNQNTLLDYLKNVLQPALKEVGVNYFQLFTELGQATPKKIWLLISYPDAATYVEAQQLFAQPSFLKAAKSYNTVPPEQTIYNRFSSMLLLAFKGMPQLKAPTENARLFELRIYEGYSEDAVRRKIKMFDEEEIELFLKVGLHPVFFGDMIAGPHRPSLVYLLNFKDMEERDANWATFLQHPEWNEMKAKEEYANTVSNIIRVFLEPISLD